MRRNRVWLAASAATAAFAAVLAPASGAAPACASGYVAAHLSWGDKCLHAGEACKAGNAEYRRYGFTCPAGGRLVGAGTPAATNVAAGRTVLLGPRTRTSGCTLGPLPDRRCSPGAFSAGLTKAVICSAGFRTGSVRDVPESEKHAVEVEYGLAPRSYGSTLEIDHIISLELGGSNDIANLFAEEATLPGRAPGYHVKDRLENALHELVCAGRMSLAAARRGIAGNWETLYVRVFGAEP
jgi:hypothetical protein